MTKEAILDQVIKTAQEPGSKATAIALAFVKTFVK